MTTRELEQRVRPTICLSGQFSIIIEYKGKEYRCKSNNTLAYDRYTGSDDWNSEYEVHCGYTYKQALQAMYDECKRKNYLGEYKY